MCDKILSHIFLLHNKNIINKINKMQTYILIGLFICHFLADYTHLSTNWMLNAKRLGKPLHPILIHAMVHTLLMGY